MTKAQFPNIPGYEIENILGKGGMGIVYLAIQKSLNRLVALKVTLPALAEQDESFNQRFVQEANITASLNNSNIITIYDSGVFEKSSYMSMEYISTGDLSDLDRSRLNDQQICELFIGICRGLAAAHKAKLVHRDIKPDNILINEEGKAIVTDFGIVKTLNDSTALTKTGLTIGSPKYMSPEQILAKPLDGRSDLYSVGIMLYDFLEGKVPFDDLTPSAIHIRHLQEEPKNLSVSNQIYQPIISKLLMKNKDDRYNSAEDLINAFQIVSGSTIVGTQIHIEDTQVSSDQTIVTDKSEPISKLNIKANGTIANNKSEQSSNSNYYILPSILIVFLTIASYFGYHFYKKTAAKHTGSCINK